MLIYPVVKSQRVLFSLLLLSLGLYFAPTELTAQVPDFTKGEAQDPKHHKKKLRDKAMGPTGLWGQVYQLSMKGGATREARQFLVTKVEEGSPADGKIEVGDVVLGVSGQDFDDDARKQLAGAIQEAEATNGQLSLKVWREGYTKDLTLMLKVMGAFDPANPFNCAYTDGVIEQMVAHVTTVGLPSPEKPPVYGSNYPFMPAMYGLGLLATGNEELMPKVRDLAHLLCLDRSGKPIQDFEVSSQGKRVWHTSYKLIFLAEYYMATGDEHVLPVIEILAVGGASGQSGVGSYGHRFSSRKKDGSFHGPLEGYGAINNASLSMLTGLVLASKCGIDHPEVTGAIARGKRFYDFFVEHGALPYGDHWAQIDIFENNGTSGLSAIAYGLMGDDRGQHFFSSMAVGASPTGREDGHQGSYWSYIWSTLGAARSGQKGLSAAFHESRYLRTLERRWDGQVIDPANIGPTKYSSRGDVTGERLLLMSLGRKNLYFTGKNMEVNRPLEGQALADTILAGQLIYNPEKRKALSEETIFRLLRHELPPVRITAAKAMREQELDRVDRLIGMINDPDRYARYGACNGLAHAGWNSKEAVNALLLRMVQDEDILFRYFAVNALSSGKGKAYGLYDAAAKAVPVLLKLASEPAPNDPRGHLTWQISEALFYWKSNLFKTYPPQIPVAERLLIESLQQFLLNENGRARSQVPLDTLTEEQLSHLWGGIIEAVRTNAPSGIMFSKGVRESGLAVLAKYRIKEGLDVTLELAEDWLNETGNSATWVPWFAKPMIEVLPLYGQDAMRVVEVIEKWPVLNGRGKEIAKKLPELKEKIRNSPDYDLISVK